MMAKSKLIDKIKNEEPKSKTRKTKEEIQELNKEIIEVKKLKAKTKKEEAPKYCKDGCLVENYKLIEVKMFKINGANYVKHIYKCIKFNKIIN